MQSSKDGDSSAEETRSCRDCDADLTKIAHIIGEHKKSRLKGVHLCLTCFSKRVDSDGLAKEMLYLLVDSEVNPFPDFSIFSDGWSGAEELALLNGIRGLGMDWDAIAKQVMHGSKDSAEVRRHYLDTYLGVHGSVLPAHYIKEGASSGREAVALPLKWPTSAVPSNQGQKARKGKWNRGEWKAGMGISFFPAQTPIQAPIVKRHSRISRGKPVFSPAGAPL
ncbi:unnamed protein product [Discosporangium mesarthrocarpum]